jgi:hypothetical protein
MPDSITHESIFQISPKIVSAEVATFKGERLFSQTREGSIEIPKGQEVLLKLRSELIAEINRRSDTPADEIEYVLTSYGNRYGLIIPRGERYLRLSVEKDATIHELMQITEAAKRLEI